jgi:hypothetical protein
MFVAILARIVEWSLPARLKPPFWFLNPVDNVRVVDSADELLSKLGEFPREELERAGVIEPTAEGASRLAPQLAPGSPFFVVRSADGDPVDLVGAAGCLSEKSTSLNRMLFDGKTQARGARRDWIIGAFTSDDVALFAALKLPVVLASDLATLHEKDARRLFIDQCSLGPQSPSPPATENAIAQKRPTLILTACSLATLRNQYPGGFLPAVSHIERIQRVMKVDMKDRIKIWLPTVKEFERIDDCVRLAGPQLLHDAVVSSVRKSSVSIEKFSELTTIKSNDVLTARARLNKAIKKFPHAFNGREVLIRRLNEYKEAHAIEVVDKARRCAMIADNPLAKGAGTLVADLLELQFSADALVCAAEDLIATGRVLKDQTLDERLEFCSELGTAFVRIMSALQHRN